MSVQARQAKVFAGLLISVTTCAIILMALGNNPPSAGAFCLNRYYELDPIEHVIASKVPQHASRWNCIEIQYSQTPSGNIQQLAQRSLLADMTQVDCHFVVCNGNGGANGQIQPTEKWMRQWSIMPGPAPWQKNSPDFSYADPGLSLRPYCTNDRTILICVIGDYRNTKPTDYQITRTEMLVQLLRMNFDIPPEAVHYPYQWR